MSQESNMNDNEVVENTSKEAFNAKESKDKKESKNILKKIKLKTVLPCLVVGVLGLGLGFSIGQNNGRKLPATYKSYNNSKIMAPFYTSILFQ